MRNLEDLKIKVFADGADIESIKKLDSNPIIKGFTTNPSLMKKAGVKDYKSFSKEVLKLVGDKPVSLEVFSDELSEMESQAKEIASWGKNVFVKIPITNSKSEKTLGLIKNLSNNKIKCNVTAIMTLQQVEEVCNALSQETESIISVFAGRIADTGIDPIETMKKSISICSNKKKVEILWASTREIINIFQADKIGTHIITVPHEILKKMSGIGKDLNQLSLETVKMFLSDATNAGFKIDTK